MASFQNGEAGDSTAKPLDNEPAGALLIKKRTLLRELLKITREAAISVPSKDSAPDNEADAFIALYDSRGSLLSELSSVQKILSESGINDSDRALSNECDMLVKKITELDKSNLNAGKQIFNGVKDSIRRINMTKSINSRYANPNLMGGHMLDNKN